MLLIRWVFLAGRNRDGKWRDICHDHGIGQSQPKHSGDILSVSHTTIRFIGD
jgi:hypothetical protein